MQRITGFFVFFCLFHFSVFAQQISISGKVSSLEDQSGIPGATVKIKGKPIGTTTDIDGRYALAVGRGDIVVFSFLGYATQEIAVGSQSRIDVVLAPADSQLDEVVVTALGLKRQKRELGYTVESVQAKEIQLSNAVFILFSVNMQSPRRVSPARNFPTLSLATPAPMPNLSSAPGALPLIFMV